MSAPEESKQQESTKQQPQQEESFSYGDDIKISRNAHDALFVPLGGVNTPSGMTDNDWQTREILVEAPVDSATYGPVYVKLEGQRKVLASIKKVLAVLHKHVITHNASPSAANKQQRDAVVAALDADMLDFSDVAWYQQYRAVIVLATREELLTADELITFAHDDIKRLTQQVFNYNMKLMQDMKAEKKAAVAATA